MTTPLPKRRYTSSLENYWRGMFNDFAALDEDHAVSGWSAQGLCLRFEAYCRVLKKLALNPGARILDLGCGAGVYSRFLGGLDYRVVGVDYAWKVAAKARKNSEDCGAAFLAGDAGILPFADGIFDHVLCIGLFQSLSCYQEVIREIYRVLKPGGPLCLMTLNRRNLGTRFDRLLNHEEIIMVDSQPQPRLSTYDPKALEQDLQRAGFNGIEDYPVQIYPRSLAWIRPFFGVWNRIPLAGYLSARSIMLLGYK
ncbi:MAG: class I SAM-dependent methyltransferase [Desulfurivibrionaceae bacterium]